MFIFYHPFFLAFAYGIGIVVSLTSLVIDVGSFLLFESSRIQYFMFTMNMIMLLTSCIFRWVEQTTIYWGVLAVLGSTYELMFIMYAYIRIFPMMGKTARRLGYLIYIVEYPIILQFQLASMGFLSMSISAIIFISSLPMLLAFVNYQMLTIIILIKQNPLHSTSVKQSRLMIISLYTVLFANFFAIPSAVLVTFSGLTNSVEYGNIGVGFTPFVGFVYSISNFLMIMNKYLQEDCPKPTGSSIFK